MTRRAGLVALLVVGALALPPSASADRLEVAVQDDGSIVENWNGRREFSLYLTRVLRASWVRITLTQARVRSRGFGDYDQAIARILAYGLKPQVTITFGKGTPAEMQTPERFAEFVTTVATRYRGQVPRYSLYNEPNLTGSLPPLPGKSQAMTYRAYYQAGYAALRAVDPSAQILIGELGSLDGAGFVRQLACIDSAGAPIGSCAPLQADGLGYHPYQWDTPPTTRAEGAYVGIGRLDEVDAALGAAHAARALTTRTGARVPLYLTEFGYFSRGRSATMQRLNQPDEVRAQWLPLAFAVACLRPNVKQMSQFQLIASPEWWGGTWDTSIVDNALRPDQTFWALRSWIQDHAVCIA